MNFSILLLGFVGFFCITVNGDVKECAAVGGYCSESSQCCSKLCMSYLAKCVSNPHLEIPPNYPYPTEEVHIPNEILNPNCLVNGRKCQEGTECCSGRCMGFLKQCVS